MKDEKLYSYFNNSADTEDILYIEEWLKADPHHQKEFDDAHAVYDAMVFQEANYVPAHAAGRPRRIVSRFWKPLCGVAASLVLIALAGYAGKQAGEEIAIDRLASCSNVIEIPAGQSMSIVLSDGTKVFLNGGSRLEYPPVFAKDVRHVKLSGEAFLNVEHDEAHPFRVETFDSMIEVLGTEFNVYADEENGHFSTTLLRGKVKVSTLGDEEYEQVILCPDEKATRVGSHLVVTTVRADDVVSWIDGYINIGGVGFEELMHRFEDAYNVRIVLERKDIGGYMSGKIRVSEGVDFALHLLQEACDFSYEKDEKNNTIIIR
ncbi:MAG: FecR domain-containing protein [Bacteroidales bacterium]|nr:FecR domain-containing protein [Bacteroidales bacterium]MDE6871746.1 FecR domain-containing protein [Bacteroidales bacterium]